MTAIVAHPADISAAVTLRPGAEAEAETGRASLVVILICSIDRLILICIHDFQHNEAQPLESGSMLEKLIGAEHQ